MKYKQTKPHRKDCPAMKCVEEGSWSTPWYFPNGYQNIPGTVRRDAIGRKGNGTGNEWLVLRCNSHSGCHCEAEMLVSMDMVMAQVPHEQ